MNIDNLLRDAARGGWPLWKLNFGLLRGIPFNKPHRIQILKLEENKVVVKLPYMRKNLNHLKGIHACALATLCEYTTGLLMLRGFGAKKYRLIMKSLKMDYYYQAKQDVMAAFELKESEREEIHDALNSGEAHLYTAIIKLYDDQNNHICTGRVEWQLKLWSAVRTKA